MSGISALISPVVGGLLGGVPTGDLRISGLEQRAFPTRRQNQKIMVSDVYSTQDSTE